MPAAVIVAVAVGSGAAAAIGTAVVGTIVAGTVSTAVATAVGAGIISGAVTAAQGGNVSQVLKSAVIGGITSGVGAAVGGAVAGAVSQSAAAAGYTTIASTLGTIAGQTVGGGVASALGAAAYGQDPIKALIQGGLTAGLSAGVMEAVNFGTSKIPGFGELPTAVQRATKSALAAGALGKDPEKAALNSFLASGSRYLGAQLKDFGNDLKTSYDAAQSKGTALETNVNRQQAIVDEYTKLATSLNADYDKVQSLTAAANEAVNLLDESEGLTPRARAQLQTAASAKVTAANDFIAEYNQRYEAGKPTLDALTTELNELKTALPTLEKDFTDSKTALETTTKLFNEQEARNAEILANTTKNLEQANTLFQDNLGMDLSDDFVRQFVESGDVLGSAQAYVDTTNQAAQNLGFENYRDQTTAAEAGFNTADQWNQYQDTSGVVSGIAPGIEAVSVDGTGADVVDVFQPAVAPSTETLAPGTDYGDYVDYGYGDYTTPVDQIQQDTFDPYSGMQTEPFSYQADQLYQDTTTPDYGQAVAEPTFELPSEPATTSAVIPEPEPQISTTTDVAKDVLADTSGIEALGLRGLVTQPSTPSPTSTDYGDYGYGLGGEESLVRRGVTLTEPTKDLTAGTPGSATYSALTGADPTKTITGSVLGEDIGDVRGGIESSALYSGTEEELAPSDLVSSKYFAEKPAEKKALEDIGLTGEDTTEPSALLTAATPVATSYPVEDRLPLLTSTTLPTSPEAAQTAESLKGNDMSSDYDPLLTPDGVDESFLRNLSPDELERYFATQREGYAAPDYGVQDLGISQENIDSFNRNFNPVGGFSSGWQTVGSDRIMVQDDGSAIGINTETNQQYSLSPGQVQQMVAQGLLNTPASGYAGAGAGGAKSPSLMDRVAGAITKQFEKDPLKFLTAAGGAIAGATSRRTGIQPRGLQSLAPSGGQGLVQTGAKGTRGRGGVKYFERKGGGMAQGGAVKGGLGYLKSAHDGMADQINATIDNKRPAKLSGGEFVVPADVVSHLGNGNSEAGAKQLYALMERVRKARTGTPKQGRQINPKKYLPK